RYADANSGSPGKSSKLAPDSALVNVVPASRKSASRGLRSSPSTVATRMPETPSSFAVSIAARAAEVGLIPPAFVMSFVAPGATRRQRLGQIARQVARVPERLVALAVLLQDRERQLGQRFEAEVIDPVVEEAVDRGRGVPVEALAAADPDRHQRRPVRRGRAGAGGPRVGPARFAPRRVAARPRGRRARPAAIRSAGRRRSTTGAAGLPAFPPPSP